MQTLIQKTSNQSLLGQHGFSLIEIMVALVLAALVFLAVPSGDNAQKHRALQTDMDNLDRSIRFAANEAVLRNTVVRLRISLDESPVQYTVEYGPAGNLPLPDMPENLDSLSLAQQKAMQDKTTALSRQFTKVSEFEDIKRQVSDDVTIFGVATNAQKGIMKDGEANIYFYPTGEKDAALIFFSTTEEVAHLEIEPFLQETRKVFFTLDTSRVAKLEDLIQTRMSEVYQEWGH